MIASSMDFITPAFCYSWGHSSASYSWCVLFVGFLGFSLLILSLGPLRSARSPALALRHHLHVPQLALKLLSLTLLWVPSFVSSVFSLYPRLRGQDTHGPLGCHHTSS